MYPGHCDPSNIFRFDEDAVFNAATTDSTMEDIENHWTLQDFEFGKVLGEGGFGKVYLVRERKSMCVVALKVIEKFREEEVICPYVLSREGKAPNVFGFFHTKKYVCLIVEYAPGGNLSQILNDHSLSEGKIVCIMHQLCDIIAYMHERKFMHRDIKPDNILLGANNKLLLADFGISAYHDSPEPRNTFCGTLKYMAPEFMKNGHKHTNAVDIWSLGIVFYVVLFSGEEPSFDIGGNVIWPQANHVKNEAREFMMQMLNIDPTKRISAENALKHPFISKILSET